MPSPSTLEQRAHKILGGLAIENLSNNNEIEAIEQCKFANRPRARARAASHDRSIEEQEPMMSEEKSQK